jgi:SAM-dependent methyltransferase
MASLQAQKQAADAAERAEPNREQLEFWDSNENGKIWIKHQALLDGQLESFSRVMFDQADIRPGLSVVDVGCGCGTDTLTAARQVSPIGRVLGLDLSRLMLARAIGRAAQAELFQAHFLQADAQTYEFEPGSVDRIISRFGIMFFADPVAAFANLARALAPAGQMTFLTWQAVDKNPWMMLPVVEALQLIKMDLPTDPHAPGPFTFADADRLARILLEAGFARTEIEAYEPRLVVAGGRTLDDAVDFVMEFLPMRRALKTASVEEREHVHEAIRGAIGPYESSGGVIMPSAAWIVKAYKT